MVNQIRAREIHLSVGETVKKKPWKAVEQSRGERTQRFKKGGKLGQGVGALKRGAGTPLRTMPRSSWKQKYGVYGFPQKAFRIPDNKKDTNKPHHKLLHRF